MRIRAKPGALQRPAALADLFPCPSNPTVGNSRPNCYYGKSGKENDRAPSRAAQSCFHIREREIPGGHQFKTAGLRLDKLFACLNLRYRPAGFVESAINQVVSKRMVKKQQMGWSQSGAHLLLQIRTRVLDEEWENTFRRWYPDFRPQGQAKKAACPPGISRSPWFRGG